MNPFGSRGIGMRYSAMVEQKLKSIGLRLKARIQTELFEDVFRRRVKDDTIRIPKALEANFDEPETPKEARITRYIEAYRERRAGELEAEMFKQKKRLADANRTLALKETRKALEDRRIATHKIDWHLQKRAQLKRATLEPDDSRIFPFWYAPVLVREAGQTVIKPMRYHCGANGLPERVDRVDQRSHAPFFFPISNRRESSASLRRMVPGAEPQFVSASRQAARFFPCREARGRCASVLLRHASILYRSSARLFLPGVTSRSYRPRASLNDVFSASVRD